jgi:hypothetical protein
MREAGGAVRWLAAIFIALHGAVHLMGVALLWKLAEPGGLQYADAVPTPGTAAGYLVGFGWLLAGATLVVTAWTLVMRKPVWPALAVAGALGSSAIILINPGQAYAGLVANAMVLGLAVLERLAARTRTT